MASKTRRSLIWSTFLFAILLTPATLCASQPEGGWQENAEVSAAPLTLIWDNPDSKPKCLIWMQDYAVAKPHYVSEEQGQIVIERKGINSIPIKLLFVPENSILQPTVLDVPEDAREIHFAAEPIPENEVWFWGITPENPFPPPSGPAATDVSVRLLRKPDVYAFFYGAFVWHITRDDLQYSVEPFYFGRQYIASVSSEGFHEATDVSKALCRAYTGVDLLVVETNQDCWGRSYQIKFEIRSDLGPSQY